MRREALSSHKREKQESPFIDIPKKILLAEKTHEIGFSPELRMLAAVNLYELGRLSSGSAAELAGMTRAEFLLNLNPYRVFPFASELADLEEKYYAGLLSAARVLGELVKDQGWGDCLYLQKQPFFDNLSFGR